MAVNAGESPDLICDKIQAASLEEGWDFHAGKLTKMVESGVIDPVKVVRTALRDAASVAGLLITTEAMLAEKPEEKGAAMPPMPDMVGGMGVMVGMM